MGQIVHLAYKKSDGSGVPSPVDGNPATPWPLDYWASLLQRMSAAGVTVPLLPPMTKGASLGGGWDPFDHYDLGSKNQRGRRETRYGSREQAQRLVAIAYANGMEPAVNIVHHHIDGDSGNYVYEYVGADGKTKNGRFPKDKNCFWTIGPQDPDVVPEPQWDISFGREFEWLSGAYGDKQGLNGPGYVGRGLIESLKWQLRTLGAKQVFWDDLKGTSAAYIAWATNTLWRLGLIDFAWGEYFEGNRDVLNAYIDDYPIVGSVGCLDFSIRFALENWCNNPGSYDMRQLLNNGLHWINPTKAVTFTDDADTDLSEPMYRVLQGCAAIATMPGYPMWFGKYMFQIPGSYGLMDQVLNLMWIHSTMANGPITVRATDHDFLIYERPQAPGLLVALGNKKGDYNNPADWTPVTVQTAWWSGTHIHDYTGHSADQWVDSNGRVTIWVPPADDSGRAYVCFGQAGLNNPATPTARPTHQTFYGADDLDTPAATPNGSYTTMIWCSANSSITLDLDSGAAEFEVVDSTGKKVIPRGELHGETTQRGWHKITAFSASGPSPYSVNARYWGTQDLHPNEFGTPNIPA